ncbi:bifunctional folylpolyglutamate synthase/dihydrofolate synthase [Streptomyces californicus]
MSEPRPDRHDEPDPDETFEGIVDEATQRDPDLAVIEAGSRTLRTHSGQPQGEAVPARPADPETDKALRAVEQELAGRWARPSWSLPSRASPR